jgi:hypothetical protein
MALLAAYVYVSRERVGTISGAYDAQQAEMFFRSWMPETGNADSESIEAGGTLFRKAAANGSFSLWFEPQTGRISLRDDKGGGAMLAGSPAAEELARETVKGQWKSNLSSPLLFRYLKENETKETQGNLVDQPLRVEWRAIPDGVGILYAVDGLGFRFYVEYVLHDDGMSVSIPENGLLETTANKLVSVELLPFFGAVPAGGDGYLLVPDGPGGLISFDASRNSLVAAYDSPVYGTDRAVPQSGSEPARSPINYPVFGMNRGENGFVAVIDRGEYRASVYASPAGLHTGFHAAGAKFAVRRPYNKPTGLNKKQTAYETFIQSAEMGVRYIVLQKGQTDYVAMAKAYRAYLSARYRLSPISDTNGEPPLYLDAVLAATESARLKDRTVVATRLDRVRVLADTLLARGVGRLEIGLVGWSAGGYPGKLPARFPVEPGVGGEPELRALLATEEPGKVGFFLADTFRLAADTRGNGFGMKDAVRMLDRRILQIQPAWDWYGKPSAFFLVRPPAMEAALEKTLPAYKRLGASGIGFMGMDRADGDYGSGSPWTREQTAQSFRRLLERTADEIGRVMLYGSPAYALGSVTHMAHMPLETNYDFVVDEQVPFYPIALHGLVGYSGPPGNVRGDRDKEFLRAIEYGALPYYAVTDESPRLLKKTPFSYLYSSRFDEMLDDIVEEYRAFAEAGRGVWGRTIEGHRRLAEGVYETFYAGGRTVWVNYNDWPFALDGQRVEASSFRVVKEGGSS